MIVKFNCANLAACTVVGLKLGHPVLAPRSPLRVLLSVSSHGPHLCVVLGVSNQVMSISSSISHPYALSAAQQRSTWLHECLNKPAELTTALFDYLGGYTLHTCGWSTRPAGAREEDTRGSAGEVQHKRSTSQLQDMMVCTVAACR